MAKRKQVVQPIPGEPTEHKADPDVPAHDGPDDDFLARGLTVAINEARKQANSPRNTLAVRHLGSCILMIGLAVDKLFMSQYTLNQEEGTDDEG